MILLKNKIIFLLVLSFCISQDCNIYDCASTCAPQSNCNLNFPHKEFTQKQFDRWVKQKKNNPKGKQLRKVKILNAGARKAKI